MTLVDRQAELEHKRIELEQAMTTLRAELRKLTSEKSRARVWAIPLLAASIGIAVAVRIKSRRRDGSQKPSGWRHRRR